MTYIAVGAFVDIRVADDEEDVFRAAECDAGDAFDVLEAELGNGLACLFLVAAVNGYGGAGGDAWRGFRVSQRKASMMGSKQDPRTKPIGNPKQ